MRFRRTEAVRDCSEFTTPVASLSPQIEPSTRNNGGLFSVLRVEQIDLQPGLLRSLHRHPPKDACALHGGRGDKRPKQPPSQSAQPLGQRGSSAWPGACCTAGIGRASLRRKNRLREPLRSYTWTRLCARLFPSSCPRVWSRPRTPGSCCACHCKHCGSKSPGVSWRQGGSCAARSGVCRCKWRGPHAGSVFRSGGRRRCIAPGSGCGLGAGRRRLELSCATATARHQPSRGSASANPARV